MEGQAGRRLHPPSPIAATATGGTANDTPTSAASAAAAAARAAGRCRRAMAFTAAPAQRSEQRMSWEQQWLLRVLASSAFRQKSTHLHGFLYTYCRSMRYV